MKRLLFSMLACGSAIGCAAMPTLLERPEEYHLYRATRVAPTLEERLRAADRYLRQAPSGVHAREVREYFGREEEKYYLASFNRLASLYAYEQALPDGPHIENVRSRITALENRRRERQRQEGEIDVKARETLNRLSDADSRRRAFVGVFKEWTARLLRIRSFGEPTSELADETIYAFRLSEPRGSCQADVCRKLLQLTYPVPGQRELVDRAALLEIQLELERGLLRRARLAGPELWTRLAEALSLKPLPTPTPEERADAVNRAAMLVRALLEPTLPVGECDANAAYPVVILRKCRGVRVAMIAGRDPTDDDVLEVTAASAR